MMSSNKPNLTSKFSRSSLKKASSHGSTAAKVHSREEELARATTKRFNSDSWRKVSRSYRAFPAAPGNPATLGHTGGPNTQILCALSSLTEDQAFQTGSSDIPIRTASSFAASSYATPRESQSVLRSRTPTSPAQSQQQRMQHMVQQHSPDKSSTPAPLVETVPGNVTHATGDGSRIPSMSNSGDQNTKSVPAKNGAAPKNLRNAAGKVPRLSRKFRQGRLPKSPLKRGVAQPEKAKSMVASEKQTSTRTKTHASNWSIVSIFAPLIKLFKLIHYILLLPDTIRRYLTKPRWSVKGKSVLITGASSGIGAEIARQYAAQGASLALIARTQEDLEQVAKDCRGLGSGKSLFYSADLSNPVSTKLAMKHAIKDFGRFDIVILNAGRSQGCLFEEIKDPSQIENMIKLNVNGAITTLHYALPHIPKKRDARIVVISNTSGVVAAPYQTIYSATKHALTGFANSLRIELKSTYGRDAPSICLVTFPEVAGTKSNNFRMDMGAKLPPTKWYTWAGIPLAQAVRDLLPAIAKGKREYGQTKYLNLWRALYAYCPGFVDSRMIRHFQRTHYRPLEDRKEAPKATARKEQSTPQNRSWEG